MAKKESGDSENHDEFSRADLDEALRDVPLEERERLRSEILRLDRQERRQQADWNRHHIQVADDYSDNAPRAPTTWDRVAFQKEKEAQKAKDKDKK